MFFSKSSVAWERSPSLMYLSWHFAKVFLSRPEPKSPILR